MEIFRIKESRLGKSISAGTEISEGTFICRFTGKPILYKETLELGSKESFALQVKKNVYIYLDEPYRLFNHSCDPNCGLTGQLELIAIKKINKNDELTYDYSTTMLEHHWSMKCECRKENCRKVITDFDKLPKDTQQKYISLKIVQPFILKALQIV